MVLGSAKVSKLVNEPTLLLVRSFTGRPRFTLLKTLKFCQANASDCCSVILKVLPSSESASKNPGPRRELRPALPSRKAKAGLVRPVGIGAYGEALKPAPLGTFALGSPVWKALSVKSEF